MSWPPILRPSAWETPQPSFIIDGVWSIEDQLALGQHWTIHEWPKVDPLSWRAADLTTVEYPEGRREVTFEGSSERFLLIDIQHSKNPEETRVFLARIPQEEQQ